MKITWQRAIDEARDLLKKKQHNQMAIAELTLEVCEITWGGGRRKDDGRATLTAFAKELGISVKTVSNWVAIYKNVFLKLTEKQRATATWSIMGNISRRTNSQTSARLVRMAFDETSDVSRRESILLTYCREIRSLLSNVRSLHVLSSADKRILEEISFYSSEITNALDAHKVKPRNHYLISRLSHIARAAEAVVPGLDPGQIREKDLKIISYMKTRRGEFLSPTEVGMRVGRRNVNDASSWAGRSLTKFVRMGIADRNEDGHYALTKKAYVGVGGHQA